MPYEVRRTAAFDAWHAGLTDTIAQEAISRRIARLEKGLIGDWKIVGIGVGELRIGVGQGYRLYYTIQGQAIVLLAGGSKKRQKTDIRKAQAMTKALRKEKKDSAGRVREQRPAYASEGEPDEEFTFTEEELEISPWDVADYLEDDSAQVSLLRDAFESGHPPYIADAIDAVSRARARREAGVGRRAPDGSPDRKGKPTLETMMTVLKALGLRLEVVAERSERPATTPGTRAA